jgi:putative endopeptidase
VPLLVVLFTTVVVSGLSQTLGPPDRLRQGYGGPRKLHAQVRNWWKPQDEEEFETRARMLVEQVNGYGAYKACGGAVEMPGYGERTRSENVGDLGGLTIAYKAYQMSLEGRPAPIIDGFTGAQRFFLGWAQIWRAKVRPEYLRQWLADSPHALAPYRANIPPSNVAAFYDAFGVKPGDKLYRDPQKRVKIW